MAKIGRRVTGKKYRDGQAKAGQAEQEQLLQDQSQPLQRQGQPLQDKPLLKENKLIADGVIAAPAPAVSARPAVSSGGYGVELEHKPLLEKFVTLDGEQYRIQGENVLELKENERLLRQQLEANRQDDPTLNQYFAEWIERRVKTAPKPATPYRYRQFYNNHMRDSIGRMKIREIKRRDLTHLQTDLLQKVSAGTVNYLFQLLKQILNDAVADEIITKSPAANVKRLKTTGAKAADTNHRALTEEEQKDFLDAVRETFYYEYFAFLLLTGLRQGEGAALVWGNIDYEANVVHVRSTLTFDEKGHVITGPPKSNAGERDIPMNEGIRKILAMQREKLTEKFGRRATAEDRLVFPSTTGKVMHNTTANKAIERALKKLAAEGIEIEHFSCHALRDTFATRFIEQGGTPQTLKTLLGHASLAMTMDLYAHVLPNTKQKEMDMVSIAV